MPNVVGPTVSENLVDPPRVHDVWLMPMHKWESIGLTMYWDDTDLTRGGICWTLCGMDSFDKLDMDDNLSDLPYVGLM